MMSNIWRSQSYFNPRSYVYQFVDLTLPVSIETFSFKSNFKIWIFIQIIKTSIVYIKMIHVHDVREVTFMDLFFFVVGIPIRCQMKGYKCDKKQTSGWHLNILCTIEMDRNEERRHLCDVIDDMLAVMTQENVFKMMITTGLLTWFHWEHNRDNRAALRAVHWAKGSKVWWLDNGLFEEVT